VNPLIGGDAFVLIVNYLQAECIAYNVSLLSAETPRKNLYSADEAGSFGEDLILIVYRAYEPRHVGTRFRIEGVIQRHIYGTFRVLEMKRYGPTKR